MKKRLFLITLVVVVLLGGINLITRADYLSGKIRDALVERARDELGYEVGMDRLVFNFFPAYVLVERPYITGWDRSSPKRTLFADNARIYISLGELLNRSVVVKRVQLNGLNAHIVRLKDGGYNTDELVNKLSAEGGGGDAAFKVRASERMQVVLFDANIMYEDPANRLTVLAGETGADLRMLEGGYGLGCRIRDITVVHPDAPTVKMELDGDVAYRNDVVDVSNFRLTAGKSLITGSGGVGLAGGTDIALKLDARMEMSLLSSLAIMDGPVSGSARLKGEVSGVYPELAGKGSLTLEDARYAGFEVALLESGLVFDKGALVMEGMTGRVYDGDIEGSARLDYSGEVPRYSANVRYRGINSGRYTEPEERLRFIPWYLASGIVNVEGRGTELSGLGASGSIALERYDLPHFSPEADVDIAAIRKFEADFSFADETFRISSGTVSSMNTAVSLKGDVGLDGRAVLSISGRSTDIEDISAMIGYPDMDGELDVTGSLTGSVVNPHIVGKARISNAYAGGMAFPSAFGDVELSDWRLSFSDFIVRPEKGSMRLDGSIYFQGDNARFDNPYFDASLELNEVDARKITAIFTEDIQLNLTASGDIAFKGNLDGFEGRAHVMTEAGDVYGQKLDKAEVWAELTEDDISFPKVIAIRDRDILTASGRIGFDGTFEAKATSAKFDLANFDLLAGTGVPVKGTVSLSVTGGGSFDEPEISAKVAAYTLYLKDVDLGETTVDARISGGRLSGSGSLLDDKVLLDGFLEFDEPYRWKFRLAFEGGRFEPFARIVYEELPDDVSLVSTGALTAQGAIDAPEEDRAALFFSDVTATILGRELKNQGDIRMSYTRGTGVEVGSLNLKGEGIGLSASGTAHPEDGFRMELSGGFGLDGLRDVFKDSLDFIDGDCEFRLKVKGPLDDPVFTGRILVDKAGVKFRGFPQRFDDVSAELLMDGKVFRLKELKSRFGGGTVTAAGSGGLKGVMFDNFSFTVIGQDVKLKYPEELASTVQAKLFLEGAENKASISGDIFITKAVYSERIEWKSWLLNFQKKSEPSEAAAPGPMDEVALNIHVTGPQNIKVDNNVAKIPVTPDLFVRGTLGRPILLGRLEAMSGQVYFRNNAFKLSSAVVEFADPTRLNPIIDLQAETQVREYTIQLTLSGTLDRIGVSLLSDPPLEESDIITLLTLGRTTEGLAGHEAAITTGEAASFVTGQIQDAVEERVRRLTGFDRFQIDPYLTSTGASSGPRLTVGKSLFSEKLYITYSSNVGTSEDQFIRLEYLINKNLSLVGERDEMGRFGGDLKLRFNFK